jgi:hypothetical protein
MNELRIEAERPLSPGPLGISIMALLASSSGSFSFIQE